jgi:CubicO group peptidase (beta-lactamase class C family)
MRLVGGLILLLVITFGCQKTEKASIKEPIEIIDTTQIILPKYEPVLSSEDSSWIVNSFNHFIRKNRFNGSVLIAKGNHILLDTTHGFANIRRRIPLSDTSAIQLASITKPITATVILQLLEEGKLKLNDPVRKFLPNLPESPYQRITIEMLLAHQSGLSQYYYYCDHIIQDKTSIQLTNDTLICLIDEHEPGNYYPPGKKYNYCNTNYVLLALVAESIEDVKFQKIVHERILKPAGMKHSFVIDVDDSIPDNLVLGNNKFNRIIDFDFLDGIVGDKGLFSTAYDLYLFDRYLMNCSFISDSLYQVATSPQNKIDRTQSTYGYGWRLRFDQKLGKIVYHTGWWHGNRHIYFKIPQKDFTVIILSNAMQGSSYNLNELLEIFYSVDEKFM